MGSETCNILKVVLWKHLMVRIRRFFHTFVDLFSSLPLFIFLFLIKDWVFTMESPPSHGNDTLLQTVPETMEMPVLEQFVGRVLYAPESNLTNELMANVADLLKLPKVTGRGDTKGYTAFANELDLIQFMESFPSDYNAIIFQDLDGATWPKNLNYTIRIKGPFYTKTYKSLDDRKGPHESFGMMYYEFMAIQWAVDRSYLKILTGNPIEKTLLLQEFAQDVNDKKKMLVLNLVLTTITWISPFISTVFLITRLLDERGSGIQELMKMVGVTSNILGVSHYVNILPSAMLFAVVVTVLLKTTANPLLLASCGSLIALFLFVYYISIMALGFCCSYIAKSTRHGVSLAMFAYIILYIPGRLAIYRTTNPVLVRLSCLLPHVAVCYMWDEVCDMESYGRGLTLSTMLEQQTSMCPSVGVTFMMMIVQTQLLFMLAWYLERVRPGKYGIALPWNFLCQKQYWVGKKVSPDTRELLENEQSQQVDHQYFETAPPNQDAGIVISNVSKVFGGYGTPKTTALQNVSLKIYRGEITVLLGHNGAGKTTLMSIITGMLASTTGRVYVNGMDNMSERDEVRRELGVCPQHNLSFPHLSVRDHVVFFTMLKGTPYKQANRQALELLSRLGIRDKAHSLSSELSGGMKRRLQLACALAGGASVLILDEPTSGLDVESRRDLWNVLLSLRGERTVLLTTHIMEEADALGDRVAALHTGRVRCHATPMYLKRIVGTGYRLSLTTLQTATEPPITQTIKDVVPEASIRDQTMHSITYTLPSSQSDKFPELFRRLEDGRSDLKVDTIGVGVTTLEEVFMKLCSDVDPLSEQTMDDHAAQETTFTKIKGYRLYLRQFEVLMKRQLKYTMSTICYFIIIQFLLPIACIMIFSTPASQDASRTEDKYGDPVPMNLDIYQDLPMSKALYTNSTPKSGISTVMEKYPGVEFRKTDDVSDEILYMGRSDIPEYNRHLIGIDVNESYAKIFYTTTVRHTAPVALNILANVLASQALPWARDGQTITTLNHPFEPDTRSKSLIQPKSFLLCANWAIFVFFAIMTSLAYNVSLPVRERLTCSRQIHIMAGCPPGLYWLVTLCYHMIIFTLFILVPCVIITPLLDDQGTFTREDFVWSLSALLVAAALAGLSFCYLMSFWFGATGVNVVLVVIAIFCGFITPVFMLELLQISPEKLWVKVANVVFNLFPSHTAAVAATYLTVVARLNAFCHLNIDKCPALLVPEVNFDAAACCASTSSYGPHSYFDSAYSFSTYFAILCVQFVVYMSAVVALQYGYFSKLKTLIVSRAYKEPERQYSDRMVQDERVYVNRKIHLPPKSISNENDAMLVSDLEKCYVFGNPVHAVKGISFSVKKGECFGLLGVNGAGKSTTFRMLTGGAALTRGSVTADGNPLDCMHRTKYLTSLGYCPQFEGVDLFLSGAGNLELLLTLHGLRSDDVAGEVATWIKCVGLERYASRAVRKYSGGCARRLEAAAGLCTRAPLALLDEPTAGVDPVARRRVWAALRRGLRSTRSIIITSHSMDEMEYLCDRVAIMCAGELCALGTVAELRAQHARGHALRVKLRPREEQPEADAVDRLKSAIHGSFKCVLKDEHSTMLHYHLPDLTPYSELFERMEQLKSSHPVIEDYTLNETSLEEVFLSFAKGAGRKPVAPEV